MDVQQRKIEFEARYKMWHGDQDLKKLEHGYLDNHVQQSWIWFNEGYKFFAKRSALAKLQHEERVLLGLE